MISGQAENFSSIITQNMWKSILILALFTYNGLCQLTDIERQWEDGDARQNCTRICTQSCQNCTEPITCSNLEHKCPQDESEITNDCPPNDVCVPIGCQCRFSSLLHIKSGKGETL